MIEPDRAKHLLSPQSVPEDIAALQHIAREKLAESAESVDVPAHLYVEYGDAAEVTKKIVREQHIDAVVVGAHGHRGFKKLMLGSVAEAIMREVDCPVFVVRPSAENIPWDGALRHVLYAVEPHQETHEALRYAIWIAEFNHALLTLLSVLPEAGPANVARARREAGRELLANLFPDHNIPPYIRCRIEFSHSPLFTVINTAYELSADLLVLDVRRAEPWAAHLPDITYRIVGQSPCPLLSVRTHTGGRSM